MVEQHSRTQIDRIQLEASGIPFVTDPSHLGELSVDDSADPAERRARFERDGYLFWPGLLDPEAVLSARREILTKYAIIGEIDDRHPLEDAVAGDGAAVAQVNLRAFSESVRSGHHYGSVVLDPALLERLGEVLGGTVRAFDFRWPRFVRPGEGCGFHCDGPYMNRATDQQLSTWIPLGRVAPHEGALVILEDSHINADLAEGYLTKDADLDELVWLDDDPRAVQERYGRRWLTTTFEPGDVLCFSMSMLHGAFDNNAAALRCRLSSDSRYHLASETPDPRWNGEVIEAHGGSRVFYPGLGRWRNDDFQDEWKRVDDRGRLVLRPEGDS